MKLFHKIAVTTLGIVMATAVGAGVIHRNRSDVRMTNAAGSADWTANEITSLSGLNTSDYYIIATNDGAKFMNGSTSSGHFQSTVFGANDPSGTNAAGVIKLEAIDAGNYIYAMKLVSTSKYMTATYAASGKGSISATSDEDGWRFSYNSGWNAVYQKEMDKSSTDTTKGYVSLRNYNNDSFRTYYVNANNKTSGSGATFKLYKYVQASGSITSVTVKGPNSETGSMTVNSGVLGFKTIQLTAEVAKSGSISTVVEWSSDDETIAVVDSVSGIVRCLANGTVTITATSTADDSKSGDFDITFSGLNTYSGSNESADFTDTTTWGTETIKVWAYNPKVTLTNVTFDNGSSTEARIAYYSGGLRVYKDGELTIRTTAQYFIDYIVINAQSGYNNLSGTKVNDNTGVMVGLTDIFDLTPSSSSSVSLKFDATSRVSSIFVYYSLNVSPEIEIQNPVATLTKGDTGTFTAEAYNATTPSIAWSSNNTSVLTINATTGAYSAVSYGEATITATLTCVEGVFEDSFDVVVNAGSMTISEAKAICATLENNVETPYTVTLQGFIVNLNSDDRAEGNERAITISDAKLEGNQLMVFGVYNGKTSVRNYAVINGVIEYTGKLVNFNGTFELKDLTLVSYTDDAMTYAKSSYEALDEACELGTAGVTDEAWNALAEAWTHVDSNSQAKLRTATNEYQYSEDIAHWIDRYDRIVASGKTNFMGRTYGSNFVNEKTHNNNNTNIIIVVSSIALISAVSVAFVMLRKRKEQ